MAMTWSNVVALLVVCAMIFFMSWKAPLVLVLLLGSVLYLVKTAGE